MKVIITGINGYIGNSLKNYLKHKKFKVYGITRSNSKKYYNFLSKKK